MSLMVKLGGFWFPIVNGIGQVSISSEFEGVCTTLFYVTSGIFQHQVNLGK